MNTHVRHIHIRSINIGRSRRSDGTGSKHERASNESKYNIYSCCCFVFDVCYYNTFPWPRLSSINASDPAAVVAAVVASVADGGREVVMG